MSDCATRSCLLEATARPSLVQAGGLDRATRSSSSAAPASGTALHTDDIGRRSRTPSTAAPQSISSPKARKVEESAGFRTPRRKTAAAEDDDLRTRYRVRVQWPTARASQDRPPMEVQNRSRRTVDEHVTAQILEAVEAHRPTRCDPPATKNIIPAPSIAPMTKKSLRASYDGLAEASARCSVRPAGDGRGELVVDGRGRRSGVSGRSPGRVLPPRKTPAGAGGATTSVSRSRSQSRADSPARDGLMTSCRRGPRSSRSSRARGASRDHR